MNTLTPDETETVLSILAGLCARTGMASQQRRVIAIRERITATKRAALPPLPAGSIVQNYRPCAQCDTPRECIGRDSCGRGL